MIVKHVVIYIFIYLFMFLCLRSIWHYTGQIFHKLVWLILLFKTLSLSQIKQHWVLQWSVKDKFGRIGRHRTLRIWNTTFSPPWSGLGTPANPPVRIRGVPFLTWTRPILNTFHKQYYWNNLLVILPYRNGRIPNSVISWLR